MEFTLYYRGPLKAATGRNKRKDHKHDLRRHFHKQLKELWKLPQLSEFKMPSLFPSPKRWRVVPCCAVSASITSHP
jgi:hypothetical protein